MGSGAWSSCPGSRPARTAAVPAATTVWCSRAETTWPAQVACRLHPYFLNRPGVDGGSDDTEGSLSWDRRSAPMSCASGPRG